MDSPLRFDFIPYPLWRRQVQPSWIAPLFHAAADLLTRSTQRMDWIGDGLPAGVMADYITRWGLLPKGMDSVAFKRALENADSPAVEQTLSEFAPLPTAPDQPPASPLRLPAQWEPIETVIVTFPVLYPPLWKTHAAMIEAISAVAQVDILIPNRHWAPALRLALTDSAIGWERVRFVHARLNDIWVRDYGPIVGLDADGKQVAIDARFAPLAETYPQADDDSIPTQWATLRQIPVHALPLFTEGGNLWSDGAGTLIMSDELIDRHAEMGLSLAEVEAQMHRYYRFDKLILTPRLWREETGHVDLVCKLADAATVLVGAPTPFRNGERLADAARLFQTARNAAGERYQVVELPMPQVYLNWGVYPVWRSYTNALTVNGRVLVPVFDIAEDDRALRVYEQVMPGHEIMPIPCAAAANGGGAVHCLTKEIPAAQTG